MTEGLEYIQQTAADSPLANLSIAPCLSDLTTAVTYSNVETEIHSLQSVGFDCLVATGRDEQGCDEMPKQDMPSVDELSWFQHIPK